METTQKDIAMILQRRSFQFFTEDKLRAAGNAAGVMVLDLIRKRTEVGTDINGANFKPYSLGYNKEKAYTYAARRYGTTEYSSKTMWLRLTGHLFSDMKYKIKSIQKGGAFATIIITIYIEPSSVPKAEGLLKLRKFWGLSMSGSNFQTERNKLKRMLINLLNAKRVTIK